MAKKPKTRILMHFLPTWGAQYHLKPKHGVEEAGLDLMQDPSIILNGILENCDKEDLRDDGVGKESLANFKAHILRAMELYEAGDFKALACSMYEFGRQTAYLDYLPYIYEGKVKSSKIDAKRPVGQRQHDENLQTIINTIFTIITNQEGCCTLNLIEEYIREDNRWPDDNPGSPYEIYVSDECEDENTITYTFRSGDNSITETIMFSSLKRYYTRRKII